MSNFDVFDTSADTWNTWVKVEFQLSIDRAWVVLVHDSQPLHSTSVLDGEGTVGFELNANVDNRVEILKVIVPLPIVNYSTF